MAQNAPIRQRDRDETRARLIAATGALLAADGFRGLGINAVAKHAQCDKVLIYRYFGGLPGLLEAYAEEGEFWWTVAELIGPPATPARDTVSAWVRFAHERHVAWLRAHAITLEILAWETVEANALTTALAAVRGRRSAALLKAISDRFDVPEGVDVQAIAVLFGAAANYLAIRARGIRAYDGIDLGRPAGWNRLADAVEAIAAALLER